MPDIPGIWCHHVFLLLANHFRLIKKSSYHQWAKTLSPPCKVTSWQQDKNSVNFPSRCACWPGRVCDHPFANVKNTLQSYFCFVCTSLGAMPALFLSQKRMKSRPASARRGQPPLYRSSRPVSDTQEFKVSLTYTGIWGQPTWDSGKKKKTLH